ncbi:hypothetical protein AVEN_112886-1 [Araneus ventricosus]|uniref:Uncharacterized protein n=1 Tax=Araneus ventricosus TaxID=182803 RepID=A0A4Y2SW12_ARAVE|nr:hypothetical protein AVEN_112886-1 [Araneus ventricosus]
MVQLRTPVVANRNERLKLALHWTVSQRVSVVQRCARAGDDATPRTDCDVKHLPRHVAIACSSTISRRCHLSTGRHSSTLRQQCSRVSGYNIPPAVDRQGCCHGMATTIPGPNAIRLLIVSNMCTV